MRGSTHHVYSVQVAFNGIKDDIDATHTKLSAEQQGSNAMQFNGVIDPQSAQKQQDEELSWSARSDTVLAMINIALREGISRTQRGRNVQYVDTTINVLQLLFFSSIYLSEGLFWSAISSMFSQSASKSFGIAAFCVSSATSGFFGFFLSPSFLGFFPFDGFFLGGFFFGFSFGLFGLPPGFDLGFLPVDSLAFGLEGRLAEASVSAFFAAGRTKAPSSLSSSGLFLAGLPFRSHSWLSVNSPTYHQ